MFKKIKLYFYKFRKEVHIKRFLTYRHELEALTWDEEFDGERYLCRLNLDHENDYIQHYNKLIKELEG